MNSIFRKDGLALLDVVLSGSSTVTKEVLINKKDIIALTAYTIHNEWYVTTESNAYPITEECYDRLKAVALREEKLREE